jgi:hypothetical protein
MSLSISEEKINAQAAALELCRNQIIIEIQEMLNLRAAPWNTVQLSSKVEEYITITHFDELKDRIMKIMSPEQEIKDYKIQLYLKNFIMEPLIDENYHTLLDILKHKVKEEIIRKFPITTVVLEENAVTDYDLKLNEPPREFVEKPLYTMLPHLNLTTNFDKMANMIIAQVKYLDDKIAKNKNKQDILTDKLKKSNYVIKVLENNCGFLLDVALKILDGIIQSYQLHEAKDKEEIQKLREDYVNYVRKKIIIDYRKLEGTSPKALTKLVEYYSKRAWLETKKSIMTDLQTMFKNDVYLTSSAKVHFRKHYLQRFRETLDLRLKEKLDFVPRADIFIVHCMQQVESNIDNLLTMYFQQMIYSLEKVCEDLKVKVNTWLGCMLRPDTRYGFKYFPEVGGLSAAILTDDLRMNLVCAALVSTPKTYHRVELMAHQNHIFHVAQLFKVDKHPSVVELMTITTTIESRREHKQRIEEEKVRIENAISAILGPADLVTVAYIIFGLFFVLTDGERDLLEIRRAVANNDIINLQPVNFRRRKLVIQVARFLRNGKLHLLNYQVVLLIETLIERMRSTHNRFVSTKVLKRSLEGIYYTDYNDLFFGFKNLPAKDIGDLVRASNPITVSEAWAPVAELIKNFTLEFISDVSFAKSTYNSASKGYIEVDADLTIQKQIDDQILRTQSFGSNMIGSPKTLSPSSKTEEELKFLGKIQYLKDNIKKMEFIELDKDTPLRSRCPIICINGFLCENSIPHRSWKEMRELYPFTEIIAINWESFTTSTSLKEFYNAFKNVSFKSLTQMVVNSLDQVLTEQKEKQLTMKSNSMSVADFNIESALDSKEPELATITKNPFEEEEEDDDKEEEVDKTANPKLAAMSVQTAGSKSEEEPLIKKKKPSLWKLWKENKLQDIFTRETLTKAALLINKEMNNFAGKVENTLNPGQGLPHPQETSNLSSPETRAAKYVPAFAMTTGVYDFYTHNPFTLAYHHSVLAGQLLGLMIERSNMLNSNTVSLCGFSLGSVFAYSACVTLYDLGAVHKVGDVILMGSCVDLTNLGQNIHKLIGSKGVIQGKLTVVYSIYDSVLAYMFRSARVGELPIGLKRINKDYLIRCLVENDPDLAAYSKEDLESYMIMKFENIDVSSFVGGHLDYMQKIMRIMQGVDFNSDLQYFKEKS